jgi:hypothetical protein
MSTIRSWTGGFYLGLASILTIGCGSDESPERGAARNTSAVKTDGSRLAACFGSSECDEGLVCYGADTEAETGTAGFCIERCSTGMGMSEAPASCPDILGQPAGCSPQGQCRIDCTGGGNGDGKCPKELECRDVDAREDVTAYRCVYPVGTGAGTKKTWEECNPDHGDADCADGNVCVPFGNGRNQRGYCAARCERVAQCLPAAGATARVLCAPMLGACSLDCSAEGSTCPKGMECVNTSGGMVSTPRCRFVPEMASDEASQD